MTSVASARRRRSRNTPPLYDHPLARAASEAGGVLIGVDLPALRFPSDGGCGAPMRVVGTSGGRMPCGAYLVEKGSRTKQLCPLCEGRVEEEG